ncbi:MAG: TRAP transporter TatT component family protein [Nitrospinales bacterium]
MQKWIVVSLAFLVGLQACSTRKMIAKMSAPLIEGQYESIHEETDLELAKTAIPANLKMLEGLLKGDSDNLSTLKKLSEGFCGYAFSFVEEDDPERASELYLRGRNYASHALTAMGAKDSLTELAPEEFQSEMKKMDEGQLPHLFWMGHCWSGWLMLNLHDPMALADISKQEWLMTRVMEMDETYYFAGPHFFFGTFYGSRSKLMGGDPGKSKNHFEKNLELTENKYLLTHLFYAKTYAIQNQDKELFIRLLNTVIETPLDVLPEKKMINKVAKVKAQKLLDEVDDFF